MTVILNFCNTLKIRIILFICGTKVLRYNKYYSYIHITIRYNANDLSHPRETRNSHASNIAFSFFFYWVRSWRIRWLTRLLSIRSDDGIRCAATPFLRLDSVYPAYSSSLRDSPTRPMPRSTKPVLRAAAASRWVVYRGSLRSRRDSSDPSLSPSITVGIALYTMRPRLSLLLETGPLKGPASPHAADMRHLHADLPDTRERRWVIAFDLNRSPPETEARFIVAHPSILTRKVIRRRCDMRC